MTHDEVPKGERVEASGSIWVELGVSGRWAISRLTRDWSEDECTALMDPEHEDHALAREGLTTEAIHHVLAQPDDVEENRIEISLSPTQPRNPGS